MTLSIRDPRAAALARDLAGRRKTTMTAAIVQALENEIERDRAQRPLHERLADIARRGRGMARPGGRDMTKEEIDAMWER
jgi:antitoxin VapB